MQVYIGKNPAVEREVDQGERVLKDLVKQNENSGRNITCDNFFYSHPACSKSAEQEVSSGCNYSEEQTRIASATHSCQRS